MFAHTETFGKMQKLHINYCQCSCLFGRVSLKSMNFSVFRVDLWYTRHTQLLSIE